MNVLAEVMMRRDRFYKLIVDGFDVTCLCIGSRASFAKLMAALVRADRAPPSPPELAKSEMRRGIPPASTIYA